MFRRFFRNDSGASVVEYGILVALIAAAVIGGASSVGNNVSKPLNTANDVINE